MKIVKFEKIEHYEDVCYWWSQHDWSQLPRDALPKTGFIVEGVAAGFLYKTDSQFAILEFIISNKNAKKEDRKQAVDLVVKNLIDEAKNSGYNLIFSSICHPSLMTIYENNGLIKTDTNMTNYVWRNTEWQS